MLQWKKYYSLVRDILRNLRSRNVLILDISKLYWPEIM
jgi:hypothetical protein